MMSFLVENQALIHQYYYLWSISLLLPLWFFLFIKMNRTRTEMIYMGILLGTSALGLDRYCSFYDYWHPPTFLKQVNIESFFYGFFWGGIASKLYELIHRKEIAVRAYADNTLVLVIVFSSFFLYVLLLGFFQMNSVRLYVSIMLLWTALLLIKNRRFAQVSILSGLLVIPINVAWYALILLIFPTAINDIWLTGKLSGVYLLGVPIEEHLYIFSLGAFGSIMFKIGSKPRTDFAIPSGLNKKLLMWVKPYWLPLALLLLVFGRIAIFGDTRIPVGKLFNDWFHMEPANQGVKDHTP